MRISDWSSDVCSSDLNGEAAAARERDRGADARVGVLRSWLSQAAGGIEPVLRRPALSRHAGLVPASNSQRALAFAARWTPEHVRGDGQDVGSYIGRTRERGTQNSGVSRVGKEGG